MSSFGTLTLEVDEATHLRDVKAIRKMDPYVKIQCRDFKWKSSTCSGGGKNPNWKNQVFKIDVKYLGDDIYFKVFDDDKGRDEIVGDGQCKISTFCAEPKMDLWLEIEHKGKDAGKIRFKSVWEPKEVKKEEHNDLLQEAQATIIALNQKKHALQDKYATVQSTIAAHEASYPDRLAAVSGDADLSAYNQAVADAEAAHAAALARIAGERNLAEDAKGAFEQHIANEIRLASETRDAFQASLTNQESDAQAAKEAAFAAIEGEKLAAREAKHARHHALKEQIREQAEADEAAHQKIAGEIKEIAEKLLEVNAQIQAKLTALTNL